MADKVEAKFEATGETTEIWLDPADPSLHVGMAVTIERGTFTDAKGETKSKPWFRGHINGKEGKPGANAKSAITGVLGVVGAGKFDNYVVQNPDVLVTGIFDVSGSNEPKDEDVWERDDAEALEALRMDAQKAFDAAEGSEVAMQAAWHSAAVMMQGVLDDTFKGNARAFTNWAKGREGSETAPVIKRLGEQGVNALSEARVFAQFDENMLKLVPVSLARGKAVAGYRNGAINSAFEYLVSEHNGDAFNFADEKAVSTIVKYVGKAFDLKPDQTVDDLADMVERGVIEHGESFDRFSPSQEAREAAQAVLGDVFLVDMLNEFYALNIAWDEAGTEKAKGKVLRSDFAKRFQAALDRRASEQEKAATDQAKRKQMDSLNEAVDAEENAGGVVSKNKQKEFKEQSATIVAAQLFNTMMAHPAYVSVMDQLELLFKEQRKRDDEAEEGDNGSEE